MTTRERLITALNGGTPDITPYSIYSWMAAPDVRYQNLSDDWKRMVDLGLGLCRHCNTVRYIEHGVQTITEEKKEGNDIYQITKKVTPAGTVWQIYRNGWHHESFIKTEADYKVMTWINQNTEVVADYDAFHIAADEVGENGVVILFGSRTPAMSINIDWAGTEKFCLDIALEVPELFELYEARKRVFIEETELIAKGPGRFIKWLENLTISMIGPDRYRQFLVPIYEKCVPILERGGKRVMVHYDGALRVIADQIAKAPFHMIESLTEAPEGDMTYAECRQTWPDKVFWANININCYFRTQEELRKEVIAKRNRAGKKGFLFEVSEDIPANWRKTLPVVLKTLNEIG